MFSKSRKVFPRTLVPVAFLVLSSAAAFWVGAIYNQQRLEPLVVKEMSLNFGNVWETDRFVWEFPIHNRSDRDIQISGFQTSCACVSIKPKSGVALARSTLKISLLLDLRAAAQGADRPFEQTIVAISDRGPVEWKVRGNVRRAISLAPSVVNLGRTYVGGPTLQAQFIASAHLPLQKLLATSESPSLSTTVKEKGGQTYQIDLNLKRRAPAQVINTKLILEAYGVNGQKLSRTEVPVRGLVQDDIQATPGTIALGVARIGTTYRETIRLSSSSGKLFRILRIDHARTISIKQVDKNPEAQLFEVSVTPDAIGNCSQRISFIIFWEGTGETFDLVLPVVWYGKTRV